jgi:hypothetical protein
VPRARESGDDLLIITGWRRINIKVKGGAPLPQMLEKEWRE